MGQGHLPVLQLFRALVILRLPLVVVLDKTPVSSQLTFSSFLLNYSSYLAGTNDMDAKYLAHVEGYLIEKTCGI